MKYIRDAKLALAIGAGLSFREKGAMSMLVDLMALHENQGIPIQPPSYIAGMLGLGQREWSQTIEPNLVRAQKIKRARRGGIEVYVFADHAAAEVISPLEVAAVDARLEVKDRSVTPSDTALMRSLRTQAPAEMIGMVMVPPATGPVMIPAGSEPPKVLQTEDGTPVPGGRIPTDREIVVEFTEDAAIVSEADLKPKTEIVPAVSALEVLERAGLPVYDHPKGEFFWARSEHTEVLNRWCQTVPLNEIVARIARAVQEGRVDKHPNGMSAFAEFVTEKGARR